jgi:iron/zinc/copper transport system substrate-binding protein
LQVVTSISILADITRKVVGDRGQVTYIVPIGEAPEHYEPVPSDFQKVSNADILFANGLGLEEWLGRIVSNVTHTEVAYLTEGAPTIPLVGRDGADPHLWFNVKLVTDHYISNILNALIRLDPEGEKVYRRNAELYTARLQELDAWVVDQVQQIAPDRRVIVTTENAFKYFGEAYGFDTAGVWELNSHGEGTPQQISQIVDLVREHRVPGVFIETTVDRRYMEAVAKDTGVPIAGKLYTDALGPEGSSAETYIGMMKYNVHTLLKGLR